MSGYRIERDTMGEMRVPEDALYGPQTQRAVENFPISSSAIAARVHPRDGTHQGIRSRGERAARVSEARAVLGYREGGARSGRRAARLAVCGGRVSDRQRHFDEHERERGDRAVVRHAPKRSRQSGSVEQRRHSHGHACLRGRACVIRSASGHACASGRALRRRHASFTTSSR